MNSSAPYNLIFMDVNMPIKNGLETTIEIRQLYNSHKCPLFVIGVTGDSSYETEQACKNSGMDKVCNLIYMTY